MQIHNFTLDEFEQERAKTARHASVEPGALVPFEALEGSLLKKGDVGIIVRWHARAHWHA